VHVVGFIIRIYATFLYVFVHKAPVQSCKKWCLTSSYLPVHLYMSVRPSAGNSLAPAGRINLKFYICWPLLQYVQKIKSSAETRQN